ncbi:uncharacterized protein [Primulina huaijiensis]|uniref:uncharacterized protein n=1 Tax=Primulina huaijiensis TaxID=1492673 RepID=UPI003CC72C1D
MQILSLEVDGEERRTLRSRIKRPKFDDDHHHQLASLHSTFKLGKQVWKGRDDPQSHEHNLSTIECDWRSCTIDVDGAISNGKSSTMPAKHILELVLDTLQRRDSYEIFAEPVDPDEAEDYYEIIKEPMDFGTMRAKLHEGMYQNLEQFEHDAFLIPKNAMHFNSSATIYFRQASAIHELAKKVFHVLKTDPENFVLEFSGGRRRSMRKAVKSHDSKNSTRCHIAKTSGSDVSSALKGTLTMSSVSEGRVICSSTEKKGKKKRKIPTNFSTGRRRVSNSREGGATDRRCTYLSWKSPALHNEINDHSACYTKPLMMLNEHGDYSYKNSLMSFAKQLGPVAQMVAKRKLALGGDDEILSVASNHADSSAFGTSLGGCPFRRTMSKRIDEEGHGRPRLATCCHNIDIITTNNNTNNKGEDKADKYFKESNNKLQKEEECGLVPRNEIIISGDSCSAIKRPSADSFRDVAKDDQPRRPVILALENYQTRNIKNVDADQSRSKKSSASVWGKEEIIFNKNTCTPLTSRFTFDIPFLKARLQQMQRIL